MGKLNLKGHIKEILLSRSLGKRTGKDFFLRWGSLPESTPSKWESEHPLLDQKWVSRN